MMKRIIISALLMSTWLLFPMAGRACSCAVPDMPKAIERASKVFVGEVIDIVEPVTADERAPLPGRFFTIKFKVQKSWKGVSTDEVEILSAQGKYGCFAYPPVSKGEKYLVYADPVYQDGSYQKGWTIITTCNRTALIREPKERVADRFRTLEFNRRDASADLKELERAKGLLLPARQN